jgi:valyl-tRNA synthetase
MLPKTYNPLEVEEKWQKKWEEWGIYRFRWDDYKSPTYVIDTPPPYPSGEFHMGTALNWTYFDIVARYKRMRGFNVFFPQGWDCHGLPTEVQVEKKYGIRKNDLPPEKFRELCVKLTKENIAHMREEMKSLGFSIDWSTEYETMDPSYYGRTQLSFIILYKKGLIYRGEHPVNWCPRCETAIADAEVEYEPRNTKLYYIKFKLVDSDEFLSIATTRPEYLHACVAVAIHPEDDRYRRYVGRELLVPIFGQKVKIIEDPEVDPEFGTGVVMICTFGDKTDVKWVKRHGLPVIRAVDERGRLVDAAEFSGLETREARERIVKKMKEEGLVEKEEELPQEVGVCWRCKTPVEILSKPQWFLRVSELNARALEEAEKVKWVPPYMKQRFVDWVKSMEWDWVISRQRIFATPIPAWYCSSCGEVIVADESQVPVIPEKSKPPLEKCPRCGGTSFTPERDVLDTWMDSSITIACHAGWPNIDNRLFPADLQPNGTDIIRTWDYYLMIRHLALLNQAPYKTVLINGMVCGEDGRKMSKSLGNYVDTSTARKKHGADALRGWAVLGASTGSDVPFSWKEVEFCRRFMTKFWNAVRFSLPHILRAPSSPPSKFLVPDRWILSKLNRTIEAVTNYLEEFRFNEALKTLHTFIWHDFCDMYLEEVKYRLYRQDPTFEAAAFALREVIVKTVKMLAPFFPHFAEEVYQVLGEPEKSVHISAWPSVKEEFKEEKAERMGEMLNAIISALRKFKSDRKMSLNQPLPRVQIYCKEPSEIGEIVEDIKGTMQVECVEILGGRPRVLEKILDVKLNLSRVGPRLRKLTNQVEKILAEEPERVVREMESTGKVRVKVGEEEILLQAEDIIVQKETTIEGVPASVRELPEFGITLVIYEPKSEDYSKTTSVP